MIAFRKLTTTTTANQIGGQACGWIGYLVDASGGSFTITLPDASDMLGHLLSFVVTTASGGATVTLATTSSQLINLSSTLVCSSKTGFVTLVSTGSGWAILGRNLFNLSNE